MAEDNTDKKDMPSPEILRPSKPIATRKRFWSINEVDELRREIRSVYKGIGQTVGRTAFSVPKSNGGENGRLSRLDKGLGRELEIDVKNLNRPSDSGVGLAEGQEPSNIPNNPQLKPSKA